MSTYCNYWNKVSLVKSKIKQSKKIDSIGIGLASPEEIRRWGERRLPNGTLIGKVDKDHTVDYESLKPIEGGLFCERIFGPVEDFYCSCERKGEKNEKFCPNCEVEFTKSRVRRVRMGYIPLAVPVVHVWYLRGRPSYIANLVGKSRNSIDRLAYGETLCESFIGSSFIDKKEEKKFCSAIDCSASDRPAPYVYPKGVSITPYPGGVSLRYGVASLPWTSKTELINEVTPLQRYASNKRRNLQRYASKGRRNRTSEIHQRLAKRHSFHPFNADSEAKLVRSYASKERSSDSSCFAYPYGFSASLYAKQEGLAKLIRGLYIKAPMGLYSFGVKNSVKDLITSNKAITSNQNDGLLRNVASSPSYISLAPSQKFSTPRFLTVTSQQSSDFSYSSFASSEAEKRYSTPYVYPEGVAKRRSKERFSASLFCYSLLGIRSWRGKKLRRGLTLLRNKNLRGNYAFYEKLTTLTKCIFSHTVVASTGSRKNISRSSYYFTPVNATPLPQRSDTPSCFARQGGRLYKNTPPAAKRQSGALQEYPFVAKRLRYVRSKEDVKAALVQLRWYSYASKLVSTASPRFISFFTVPMQKVIRKAESVKDPSFSKPVVVSNISKSISFLSQKSFSKKRYISYVHPFLASQLLISKKSKPSLSRVPLLASHLVTPYVYPERVAKRRSKKGVFINEALLVAKRRRERGILAKLLSLPCEARTFLRSAMNVDSLQGESIAVQLQKLSAPYSEAEKLEGYAKQEGVSLRYRLASRGQKLRESVNKKQRKSIPNNEPITSNQIFGQKQKYVKLHTLPLFSTFIYKEWSHRFSFLEYFVWSARNNDLVLPFYAYQKTPSEKNCANLCQSIRKRSINLIKNKFSLRFSNKSNLSLTSLREPITDNPVSNTSNASQEATFIAERRNLAKLNSVRRHASTAFVSASVGSVVNSDAPYSEAEKPQRYAKQNSAPYRAKQEGVSLRYPACATARSSASLVIHRGALKGFYPNLAKPGRSLPRFASTGLLLADLNSSASDKRSACAIARSSASLGAKARGDKGIRGSINDRLAKRHSFHPFNAESEAKLVSSNPLLFSYASPYSFLVSQLRNPFGQESIGVTGTKARSFTEELPHGGTIVALKGLRRFPTLRACKSEKQAKQDVVSKEALLAKCWRACEAEGYTKLCSAFSTVQQDTESTPLTKIDTQQFPRLIELLNFTGGAALRNLLSRFDLVVLSKFLRHELKNLELKVNNLLALKMLTYSQGLLLGKLAKRRSKQIRRLKLLELFQSQKSNPEWMILSVIPVLPPDLRPILRVNDDFVVASDLNRLYQTVLRRNNTIHDRLDDPLPCPESGLFRQRSLQKAVDGLLENGKGGGTPLCASKRRPLVSLSHVLKGKKGLFRQHLLGKRVDYSGRSVIVVGPRLQLHECGLPKEMAIELFQPFLLHRLKVKGLATSNTAARRMIQQGDPVIWHILKQLVYEHPVLLNRAPTLHRLGIQAFQPRLVSGRAILLHPLVCNGFNADFDGDQMAVHVPLSFQARAEAWKIMWSKNNFLSPATGQPILVPSQDMVLGCYYLSVSIPRILNANVIPPSQLVTGHAKEEGISKEAPYRANQEGVSPRYSDATLADTNALLAELRNQRQRGEMNVVVRGLYSSGLLRTRSWGYTANLAQSKAEGSSATDPACATARSSALLVKEALEKYLGQPSNADSEAKLVRQSTFLNKNKGHYFSNLQDSLLAYFQGRLQTHTPFWVRIDPVSFNSITSNLSTQHLLAQRLCDSKEFSFARVGKKLYSSEAEKPSEAELRTALRYSDASLPCGLAKQRSRGVRSSINPLATNKTHNVQLYKSKFTCGPKLQLCKTLYSRFAYPSSASPIRSITSSAKLEEAFTPVTADSVATTQVPPMLHQYVKVSEAEKRSLLRTYRGPDALLLIQNKKQGFQSVAEGLSKKANQNVQLVNNLKLTFIQPLYGSSREMCKTLFQNKSTNHLQIRVESNETLESPLELRLNVDGNLANILTMFQNHYNYNATWVKQCKEESIKYMRTTAGRAVINKAVFKDF
jgi:DNA-directed RNA polymerase beta' subunit